MSTPRSVAVYARISSDQEGAGLGVKRQVADCTALCERLGWPIGEVYEDNDVSAYSGKRRPSYERMLADIRDGLRDAVVVYHPDRLTRRVIELEQCVETLSGAGVSLVRFVSGPNVDLFNGDGLMVLRMQAVVAANESHAKSRRVKRKLAELAAEGRPHGASRRPFGFEEDRITHRPEEAEVIRTAAERYLAGESLLSLVRWLQDSGVRTVFDKEWTSTTLRDVLISARIAGLRDHNGNLTEAVWDPIITVDQRNRILAMREQRNRSGRRPNRRYLLTGLLRCGLCEHTLYTASRKNSRRYICSNSPDKPGCGRLTVVAGSLEQLIADAVLYRLDTPELAAALAGQAAADEQSAAIAEAVADDQRQLEELSDAYGNKLVSMTEWLTARKPIEQRLQQNERRLAQMTRNDALAGIVGNGEELRSQWAELNLSRQAAIVAAVIDRIVIHPATSRGNSFDPDRVEVIWRV